MDEELRENPSTVEANSFEESPAKKAGLDELQGKLLEHSAFIQERLRQATELARLPLQNWWQRSFWEPTVAIAIRDHCKPGDVVFDVGANAGGLSLMMSRLVGPRGIVIAFEASPRIIDKTHHNLVKAGCSNVTLLHRAVWHTTGSLVYMTPGTYLNDRIEEGHGEMAVRTVALDDLAAAGDFRPSFIKVDIEGAELDALRGMKRLLAGVRPALVLEQSPDDMRCHQLLMEAGYLATDLASYRQIRTVEDFAGASGVANILFLPSEQAAKSAYFSGLPFVKTAIPAARFEVADNGDITLREPVKLSAGRYILRADFTAEGTDNEVFAGVEVDGKNYLRYHTFTSFIAQSYRDWVIQLDYPSAVAPYLRFLRGGDASLKWNGANVFRLPAFDDWKAPIFE